MKKKIFNIFKKFSELKNIIIPLTMILVIPSAASIIFRYEYTNPQVTHIPTVIVNHDDTSTTQTLVNLINTNETFNVTFYSDNDDDVKKLIDQGKAAVGLIIPKDFSKDLIDGKAPKIMTIYYGAQLSIVGNAKGKIAEVLGTIKASFLIGIGQGKLVIMPEVS
jgi:ABC-2 type transport system permease protein